MTVFRNLIEVERKMFLTVHKVSGSANPIESSKPPAVTSDQPITCRALAYVRRVSRRIGNTPAPRVASATHPARTGRDDRRTGNTPAPPAASATAARATTP